MNEALEQVDELTNKYAELLDILKRPTLDGISDLKDWIKRNGTTFAYGLDDLRMMIEQNMTVEPQFNVIEGGKAS